MKVIINNKEENIPEGMSVSQLLTHLDLRKKTAIWVNGRQLLIKEYDAYKLSENDTLKILKIIGGG